MNSNQLLNFNINWKVLMILVCFIFIFSGHSFAGDDMVLEYDTTLSSGSYITLPKFGDPLDVTIDWGDGQTDSYTTGDTTVTYITHEYDAEGTYQVTISGNLDAFGPPGGDSKLTRVIDFGSLGLTSLSRAFEGANNLTEVPATVPSTVTDMEGMFREASSFNGDISGWDVSNVTDMEGMFRGASSFNRDLSGWDVSSVKDMANMFYGASSFNGDISGWDVSNVTSMQAMFRGAGLFNGNISSWDVSSVTNMKNMFYGDGASAFNGDLSSWDVSSVKDMEGMFAFASSFNQPIGAWNVSNVTTMNMIFKDIELSTSNYDDILKKWSTQNLENGVSFHGGSSQYSADAADERQTLIDDDGWSITDGGQLPNTAPTLGGTFISATIDDTSTVTPFSQVEVSDSDGDNVSVNITYTGANGILSSPDGGLTKNGTGDYTLDADTLSNITDKLQQLEFDPTENQVAVENTVETTFTLAPNDGTTDGSSNSDTIVTATSVNDAPIIDGSGSDLPKITRYATDNEGQSIDNLISDSVDDPDYNVSHEGIAITDLDSGTGTWQYSTDGGSSWSDIGTVTETSALLLTISDKLRFIPANSDNDQGGSITYRAWDKTSGTKGNKVDTTTNGGTTAFSSTTDKVGITVEAYSDAYVDINLDDSIYGAADANLPVEATDWSLLFNQNNGGTKEVNISSVKQADSSDEGSASELIGGETTIRVFLEIIGTPTGVETIEIKPKSNAVFDKAGNAMLTDQSTGVKTLERKVVGTPQ
ncbi:BspA family leucine-rich repeat surface protein [Halanaerobacter jeridensis]|uniref:Surface protein n=1 Tax=Halanaerobacter jeridensis TaxID=706427 RepID=A0A939BPH1_9FIRM|nr:BspA family leucine-rich repeat surface protein [Halanaerobacter jeridensis]MBM7557062.1 surface protein [Halanaerobacter jeridensis]